MAVQPGVQLYAGAHLVVGQVNPGRRRLSDHLNDPNTNLVEVEQAVWYDLLSESSTPRAVGQVTMRKEVIEVVVPYDPVNPYAPGRVQTQQLPVTMAYPLLTVSGGIHRRPTDPHPIVQLLSQQGRYFLPVGSAYIRFLPNGSFDSQHPVALVNARQVSHWWAESS